MSPRSRRLARLVLNILIPLTIRVGINSRGAVRLSINHVTGEQVGRLEMKNKVTSARVIIVSVLAVLGGVALAAQDKYTLQVPNGLAFSEFTGYEAWQVVSISQ